MPLISGPITRTGAAIEILVGVYRSRREALKRNGFPVPAAVPIRAQIDTGASISGVAPHVFRLLDATPIDTVQLLTPSTPVDSPHRCEEYLISLSIMAGGIPHLISEAMPVIVADGWHPTENTNALIGRDILARCVFQYFGPDARFEFSF